MKNYWWNSFKLGYHWLILNKAFSYQKCHFILSQLGFKFLDCTSLTYPLLNVSSNWESRHKSMTPSLSKLSFITSSGRLDLVWQTLYNIRYRLLRYKLIKRIPLGHLDSSMRSAYVRKRLLRLKFCNVTLQTRHQIFQQSFFTFKSDINRTHYLKR